MYILRKLFKRECISKICDFKELLGYIVMWKYRNSHQRCSMKKDILRNFAKFTWKHLCQSLFFNKVAGLGLRLWHRCFPMKFSKFLRAPFLQNTSRWLLPEIYISSQKNKWVSSSKEFLIKSQSLLSFSSKRLAHIL